MLPLCTPVAAAALPSWLPFVAFVVRRHAAASLTSTACSARASPSSAAPGASYFASQPLPRPLVPRATGRLCYTMDADRTPPDETRALADRGEGGGPAATNASSAAVLQEPHIVRVLSWNIDGLDERNLQDRTSAACDVILKEDPDVVCLQEVVPDSASLILLKFPPSRYQAFFGGESGYFTTILLKRATCYYDDHRIVQFSGSSMGRNLLVVDANIKGVDFKLMTAHLESTAEHSAERRRQLRHALDEMRRAPAAVNALLGGDLNLRDKDVLAADGLPPGVVDVWQETGAREETKYTWDMRENDNLTFERFSPRCRFDRFLFRPASVAPAGEGDDEASACAVRPILFQTVGRRRVPSCRRFPSDHWGILAHFFISSSVDR